ncbi:MAG: polyprenyl diphosphate synthase [Candidatus Poseidoniales archaeon]|jgi:tritrans,polycis-undecaprenyl-diphosphate synthase [geranylgeranyl-diphosphate specific]
MGRQRKSLGNRIDNVAKWLLKFRIISSPARYISNSKITWSLISRTDRIRTRRLEGRIKNGEMPNHISIIMDGNRRFAWSQSLEREIGHLKGKDKLKQVMEWVLNLKIKYLTVYALSTENMTGRDSGELESLYDLYQIGLNEIAEDPLIHSKKVKVQAVGRLEELPERVRVAIKNAEDRTEGYSNFIFTVCLAYGGREEIVDAVKEVAIDHAAGRLPLDEINSEQISNRLYSAEIPDPDLVIRTSGEERISNFLLWQIAYSELYFTDVHWPSFSRNDLYEAIESYQYRRRKYGK